MKKIEKVNKYCISLTLVRAFLLWAFLLFWWHCRRENGNFKKRSSSSYSLLFCNLLFISINSFYICYSALRLMIVHQNQWFHWSTVICQKFWEMSKNPNIIKQKLFFFPKTLLWSHFWIELNKLHTKTFGIVYILFVYLLIMFIWAVFICT